MRCLCVFTPPLSFQRGQVGVLDVLTHPVSNLKKESNFG